MVSKILSFAFLTIACGAMLIRYGIRELWIEVALVGSALVGLALLWWG